MYYSTPSAQHVLIRAQRRSRAASEIALRLDLANLLNEALPIIIIGQVLFDFPIILHLLVFPLLLLLILLLNLLLLLMRCWRI